MSLKVLYKSDSLKNKIRKSYTLIITFLVLPAFYSMFETRMNAIQYDQIIANISLSNEINQIVKVKLPAELWNIVSGRVAFTSGRHYEYLNKINDGIETLLKSQSKYLDVRTLEVAKRASLTLVNNIEQLGTQIILGGSVQANEKKLDEIRGITSLLSDILQDFIISEIEAVSITNNSIKKTSMVLSAIQFMLLIIVLAIVFYESITLSTLIEKNIHAMERFSNKLASGDLSAKVKPATLIEFKNLTENLNVMGYKIENLIKQNIEEQKNLQKAELKTLQAQITPHFLYNTFDTIIWLAEEGENEEVIKITRAFSQFLRTSLSRGHEWITMGQEIEYVRNYLTIQKVRYGNILSYEIDVPDEVCKYKMLKLTLQPLVENAIYHGIKNKRGRGHIYVSVNYENSDKKRLNVVVKDDGIGFTDEKLKQVRSELSGTKSSEQLHAIYGLYNVNKRLILYYGEETEGISIESTYGDGSTIYFSVPCLVNNENV